MPQKVLLTSAGFENKKIGKVFVALLDKPISEARILFIPTAATCAESLRMVGRCIEELYGVGVTPDHMIVYNLDRRMALSEIENYDVVYFAGGSPKHLLDKVNEAGFTPVVRGFVDAGGVYVGVSAGTLLATEIALVNCRITGVHCQEGSPSGPVDLETCPDIRLTDSQALVVDASGAAVIE